MAYLAPTYAKTASIIARAEGGEAPEGNDIGTNKVFGTMRYACHISARYTKM